MSILRFRTAIALFLFVPQVSAFVPGLYCGEENCYDLLGLPRDATRGEISKSYRKLAAKTHPDAVKGGESVKKAAEAKFRQIATAYETLKDEESRRDYDYMLDHPEEYYYIYYKYYRTRVAPKVDVRIVILVTILVISAIQYLSSYHKYSEAIGYLLTQHKYRLKAQHIATERGLLPLKKAKRKQDKAEAKEREEEIIKSIIEENIDIQGGYKRPSLMNVLAVQLVLCPYYIFCYLGWWIRWLWRFTIKREEYGEEEQLHLIRKHLKLSQSQFDSMGVEKHHEMLDKELWIYDKFKIWKHKTEEEEKRKLAENSKYKQYRRYMKNHGPGQISFVDDE